MLPNPSINKAPSSASPLRFVIAEDDHDLRYIIVHVLSQAFPDARIADFSNGLDALNDFDANGAHLAVSNHSMPVMNGPTFVRHLRERSDELPILMVSGSPEAQQEGAEVGISFFLDKEEIMSRLVPEVRSLLKGVGIGCPA